MADGLDRWREFFRGAGVGICDVIEKAILVAAADEPQEFLRRRDRTAERLYNALLTRPSCNGCTGSSTVSLPPATPAVPEDKGSVRRVPESEKESKFDSSSLGAPGGGQGGDDDGDSDSDTDDERLRRAAASNYGHNYDDDDDEEEEEEEEEEQPAAPEVEEDQEAEELEALTNEIDEESQVAGEVLRIKGLLLRKEDHSDATLFESLRRLQLMQLSVSTLRATEIGRAVNGLRKHNSQQIRHLVQTLIQDWKVLVDEWVNTTSVALADNSPGSSNPSAVDDEDDEEEGLPSPPLDEGAFFAPETTAIQLSEFFDEMDEDGNLRHNNDVRLGNKRENHGRRPGNHSAVAKQEPTRHSVGSVEKVQFRRPELTRQEASLRQASQQKSQSLQAKPQSMLNKQSRPSSSESGSARPIRAAPPPKPTSEMRYKQTQEHFPVERKPAMGHVDKSRLPANPSPGVKLESAKPKIYDGLESNGRLEAAKRRLQERYQEAENAKKQRTIQVMELGDIPKPKSHNRQPMMKSRNHIRSRAMGRR